jgi:hypothetical protein
MTLLWLLFPAFAAAYDVVAAVEPRCREPAAAGSHVLYNATFSAPGVTRELNALKYLHAVVGDAGDAIGAQFDGACRGDARSWGGSVALFPEEFEHMARWEGATVTATVARVTSATDYALIAALADKRIDAASKLINEDRVGINAFDRFGASALMVAVQMRQPILAASLLNAYGPRCDVNAATPAGYTALHFAVGQEQRQIVKALLRRGANPNAQIVQKESGGWGALHFACRFGNADIVQDLLDFDADPLLVGHAGENAFKVAEDAQVSYSTRKKLANILNAALEKRERDAAQKLAGGEL